MCVTHVLYSGGVIPRLRLASHRVALCAPLLASAGHNSPQYVCMPQEGAATSPPWRSKTRLTRLRHHHHLLGLRHRHTAHQHWALLHHNDGRLPVQVDLVELLAKRAAVAPPDEAAVWTVTPVGPRRGVVRQDSVFPHQGLAHGRVHQTGEGPDRGETAATPRQQKSSPAAP